MDLPQVSDKAEKNSGSKARSAPPKKKNSKQKKKGKGSGPSAVDGAAKESKESYPPAADAATAVASGETTALGKPSIHRTVTATSDLPGSSPFPHSLSSPPVPHFRVLT